MAWARARQRRYLEIAAGLISCAAFTVMFVIFYRVLTN
jgi:hypothetical protein